MQPNADGARVRNADDMEAYDQLSPAMRKVLQGTAQPFSAVQILQLSRFGEGVPREAIRVREEKLHAAYRAKFGLDQ